MNEEKKKYKLQYQRKLFVHDSDDDGCHRLIPIRNTRVGKKVKEEVEREKKKVHNDKTLSCHFYKNMSQNIRTKSELHMPRAIEIYEQSVGKAVWLRRVWKRAQWTYTRYFPRKFVLFVYIYGVESGRMENNVVSATPNLRWWVHFKLFHLVGINIVWACLGRSSAEKVSVMSDQFFISLRHLPGYMPILCDNAEEFYVL